MPERRARKPRPRARSNGRPIPAGAQREAARPHRFRGAVHAAFLFAALLAIAVVIQTEHTPAASRGTAPTAAPSHDSVLVGVNYTNYAFPHCSFEGTGILRTLGRSGPSKVVSSQLHAMRRAGVDSIRMLIWFTADPAGQSWGVVASAGGPRREFEDNLLRFAREVRAAGFARLTIAFGPRGANSPFQSAFDPALLGQDWRFIAAVRSIVTPNGPARTRFDLLNEGAPSRYLKPNIRAQVDRYILFVYRRYVRRFGGTDVTVSAVGASSPIDRGDRLENLVALLRGAKLPLPQFFDVHANFGPSAVGYAVADAEHQLAAVGLSSTPLVIGETAYDNAAVGEALRASIRHHPRSIEEVDEWYQRPGHSCPIDPPYSVRAYRRALAGTTAPG